MIPIIGTKSQKSRQPPGWADFVGMQSTANAKGELDSYTFALPRGYNRIIVLAIGVGGGPNQRDQWGGGGSGAGAAKAGYVLSYGDVLTIQVPRAAANKGGNDTTFNGFQAPACTVSSAKRGLLLRANAGINSNYSNAPVGGAGQLIIASDFPVQNGGAYQGGAGHQYDGGYENNTAGAGAGYAGGGGGGGHGNNGGAHGTLQTSASFVASLGLARAKFGAPVYNRSIRGSNSWSNGLIEDASFGGGAGGHSSGSTPVFPGRAFVRVLWGLSSDGGPTDPVGHGW